VEKKRSLAGIVAGKTVGAYHDSECNIVELSMAGKERNQLFAIKIEDVGQSSSHPSSRARDWGRSRAKFVKINQLERFSSARDFRES
jgi:hypothetical protein